MRAFHLAASAIRRIESLAKTERNNRADGNPIMYSDARQWWSDGDATASEPSRNVRRKANGGMAVGEATWPEINAIQVTIASFLGGTAIVAFSGAFDAADGQPAITPAVKCEALEGL